MFIQIVSGIAAFIALAWGIAAFLFNGQNMEAPSQSNPHDWMTIGVCAFVFVIGVCGVIWGGR